VAERGTGGGGGEERPELGPLPGGHHGLSREQVAESQRERLLAAVAHVVAVDGYRQTTITQIVKAAAVSSRAFYEHFDSKEECFLAAFDAVVAHLHDILHQATAAAVDWPDEAIAALRAGLDFFTANPDLARLCLVEPVLATPRVAERFRDAIMAGVPFLAAGRSMRPEGAGLPASTEDSLIGGLAVLVSRQIVSASAPLTDLLPDAVEFLLAPYLGPDRARELAVEAGAGEG
jgi:AcrR family transcriptional regulator